MTVLPYYQDDQVKIYHGDCLELINILSEQVDAAITDPPYCSGATEAAKRTKKAGLTPESVNAREDIEADNMGTLGFQWVMRNWLLEVRKHTKMGGHLVSFIDWRMMPPLSMMIEAAGWRLNNTLVWDKGYPGLGSGFRAQHEFALVASNGSPIWHSYAYGNVLQDTRLTKTEHPHQKPEGIIGKIIETCVPVGGLILDSFMGSGTTLRVAKNLGRRAIGFDLSEKHCETSARRMEQEVLI